MAYITIIGNLCEDPITKEVGNTILTEVRIAEDSGYGDKKVTTFWRVSVWGKRGEPVARYAKKGDRMTFIGEGGVRRFTKQDGTKGFSPEITQCYDYKLPMKQRESSMQESSRNSAPAADDSDCPF